MSPTSSSRFFVGRNARSATARTIHPLLGPRSGAPARPRAGRNTSLCRPITNAARETGDFRPPTWCYGPARCGGASRSASHRRARRGARRARDRRLRRGREPGRRRAVRHLPGRDRALVVPGPPARRGPHAPGDRRPQHGPEDGPGRRGHGRRVLVAQRAHRPRRPAAARSGSSTGRPRAARPRTRTRGRSGRWPRARRSASCGA